MTIDLPHGKKLYFASDFHLGAPTPADSLAREKRIIQWLDSVRADAHTIFLMGDIFDFWFEYKHAIPKGFVRLQGKLAELTDAGIPVIFFTGNHDMWMFDYFPRELGITVLREPITLQCGTQRLLLGHGDGLGPGDYSYKVLKRFFASRFCQWLFARLHPNLGIGIARYWSKKSRISNMKREEKFTGEENEFLLTYCKQLESSQHYDYYVFGHRHLPLQLPVNERSTYLNLGEWVHFNTYAVYDGHTATLHTFTG
jgi:UDP-2,3-diacylglucosamine hydrolase